jgi:hypothetical protein
VRAIVDLLVRGEYEAVARITRAVRMPADEIAEAIEEYGRTLVAPDADAW